MTKYDTIIGIDPDIERSGICILHPAGRAMWSGAASFCECTERILAERKGSTKSILVCVEGGWLVQKFNYHVVAGVHRAEKIAHDVGENHAVGKLLIQFCEHHGISCIAVHPLRKMWRGANGKITKEELERVVGMKMHRCNQDERDAVLLAWYMSGLPM